ncbi:type I-E CRISPR-associated protein Cse2/CasB [Saccharothrix obliqua]|uniref:type I-E CRISPR-associated protein Cse2/CasB n=1 Tax=Saccharothrix obliqua TaxID=2861747 RepID=UPI001C5DE22C|nr:type I-E CRISPR-associated protein Cse2/CasB [Saccharothrix obliqua]MBW4717330.1 type I-E CRISPR-associated protein Cse2/CasB [Saccharothrix obliqua]
MTADIPTRLDFKDRKADSAAFVSRIVSLCERYPGARSALRSGLGRTPQDFASAPMHRYIFQAVRRPLEPRHLEHSLHTIASLIALRPDTAIPRLSPGNLGATFAHAANTGAFATNTMDKSVQRLARQTSDTICAHIANVVAPLRGSDVPVDFALLLRDLINWPYDQRDVGTRWQQTFFLRLDHDPDL